jgi:hypothetical protein
MADNQNREVFPNENLGQDGSSDTGKQKKAGNKQKNKGKKSGSAMATDRNTNTTGYGSSQRSTGSNVGPLDADLNELPSKRRSS